MIKKSGAFWAPDFLRSKILFVSAGAHDVHQRVNIHPHGRADIAFRASAIIPYIARRPINRLIIQNICERAVLVGRAESPVSVNAGSICPPPHRADPYSTPRRYFFAFFAFRYTASRTSAAPATPSSRSRGCRLSQREAKASVKPWAIRSSFSEASAPGESRTAWQSLSKSQANSRYGRFGSRTFFSFPVIVPAPDPCF